MSLTSWWAVRWAEAMEAVQPRRGPGRSRTPTGRLDGVEVSKREAKVLVSGTSVVPHEVRLRFPVVEDESWRHVSESLVSRALFPAKLLVGELPNRLEDVFQEAGTTLFPTLQEMRATCDCTPPPASCTHVAVAKYALAEALDRDPFLLFELRGRRATEILETLGLVATLTAPPVADEPVDEEAPFRVPRGDLSDFHFHIARPEKQAALLALLGNPRGWRGTQSMYKELVSFVSAAGANARRLALEPEDS